MKYYIWTFFIIAFIGLTAWSTFAANYMRTTEIEIADSDVAISTSQDYPFTLYIGDDIGGVTPPALKSVTFNVTGVYEGNGTLDLSIDADGDTTKSYTLPNVTEPTPFEIDYKETTNKINPTSAGSYDYTLNFDPSGVTIYGLVIKMTETHRYEPETCADGSPSNQKIKTIEKAIADSDVAISTAEDYPFTLYIGDDLSGVTAPAMKSIIFKVTGVYEGDGTLGLSIDSDGDTSKSYVLPNVTNPVPFEIDYEDPSFKINPSSGGSYDYTLNFNPSGVTIYGLGIKMTETHKYKPPTCGGLPIYGDLISPVFDSADGTSSTSGAGYNSISWKGTLGTGDTGKVRFQFAASDSPSGSWNYYGGDTCSASDWFDPSTIDSLSVDIPIELVGTGEDAITCQNAWNNKRYFRYKVRICSDDCISAGTYTPTIDDIIVNWAP